MAQPNVAPSDLVVFRFEGMTGLDPFSLYAELRTPIRYARCGSRRVVRSISSRATTTPGGCSTTPYSAGLLRSDSQARERAIVVTSSGRSRFRGCVLAECGQARSSQIDDDACS